MTEQEWPSCTDLHALLELVKGQANERKQRLFAAACCRQVWDFLGERSRRSIEVLERYADKQASAEELQHAHQEADKDLDEDEDRNANRPSSAAVNATDPTLKGIASITAIEVLNFLGFEESARLDPEFWTKFWSTPSSVKLLDFITGAEGELARARQATLFRHIIGNPFKSYPSPSSWPAPVINLAEAMYVGEHCSFALHDALLEAGHAELAEHFKEKDHPKGCWVVDLILGKK
jgi:hypothetical protein